jgi:hypothetical protein
LETAVVCTGGHKKLWTVSKAGCNGHSELFPQPALEARGLFLEEPLENAPVVVMEGFGSKGHLQRRGRGDEGTVSKCTVEG